MGIFKYFSKEAALERKRTGALKKLTNMYYQQADRMGAAELVYELAEGGDEQSVDVLLARFEHLCPTTTVDIDEKEYVVKLLISLGDKGVERVIRYCKTTTKPVYWPLKALEKLWSGSMYVDFVAELLEGMDNDYWRDPEKKIGLVQAALLHDNERVSKALEPFVEDHAEDVRYSAVDALLGHDYDARELLLQRLAGEEESLRVRQRLARGFADKGWELGEDAAAVADKLPPEWKIVNGRIVAA